MLGTPFPLPSEVFITEELQRRPVGKPDYLREKRALQELAFRMVDGPQEVLPKFVGLAMEMTGGTSAGLSLYEEPGLFRWRHVAGALSVFEGATTPRNYSPCGVTLDLAAPVLTRHAETLYSWIAEADIVVPEVLLVPLFVGEDAPLGTLWIVSDLEGHFNRGHARLATELATFVGIALKMRRTEERLRLALEEQETLAREMQHRIKNLFALVGGMIRFTARRSGTPEEMAESLSGRLQALAQAHSMATRRHGGQGGNGLELRALVSAVVEPHDSLVGPSRFMLQGEPIVCPERVLSGLALVIHELATNAAKYGALSTDSGQVSVAWRTSADRLELSWQEYGGPEIDLPPTGEGFGGRLVRSTIERQFNGNVAYDWLRGGLTVTLSLPLSCLGQ